MSESKPWYKRHKYVLVCGCVILVGVIAVGIYYSRNNQQTAAQQPASAESSQYGATDVSAHDALAADSGNLPRLRAFIQRGQDASVDISSLDGAINGVINNNSDITFGVSINYLNTGQILNYGKTSAMTAASVTKVLTATDYYKQVELGHKSLTTIMSNGKTAESNIEQMIVVSDNSAWELLNQSLTYSQMQQYADSIGLSSYNSSDNSISAGDTTKLLAGVYERKFISETNTQTLLAYMERANYRDLIIPAVPANDTVYHKAGEYAGYLHDAAIITNSSQAIVITIFTKSNQTYSTSRIGSLMQQITTPTLETFNIQ